MKSLVKNIVIAAEFVIIAVFACSGYQIIP